MYFDKLLNTIDILEINVKYIITQILNSIILIIYGD